MTESQPRGRFAKGAVRLNLTKSPGCALSGTRTCAMRGRRCRRTTHNLPRTPLRQTSLRGLRHAVSTARLRSALFGYLFTCAAATRFSIKRRRMLVPGLWGVYREPECNIGRLHLDLSSNTTGSIRVDATPSSKQSYGPAMSGASTISCAGAPLVCVSLCGHMPRLKPTAAHKRHKRLHAPGAMPTRTLCSEGATADVIGTKGRSAHETPLRRTFAVASTRGYPCPSR